MSQFTHLHLHSHYSLLDGLGKIDDILARVAELGMESVALTDHGVMYGAVEFFRRAKERGIKPIIGLEAYVAPGGHTNKRGKIDGNPRHLTLLARTTAGYKNLIQLTTAAHLAGYYYRPRIDYELLDRYGEGLIVLSGCMNSDISRAILEKRPQDAQRLIEWHLNRFGKEYFFLEVQHHPNIRDQIILNEELFRYAQNYGLSVVATGDAHYVWPEDAEAQDVLICVQTGKTVQDKNRLCMLGEDFSIKGPAEVAAAWKDHPEVVENTQKIAEMCNVEIEFGVNRLPRYRFPASGAEQASGADDELRRLAEAGIDKRYDAETPQIRERLDYELEVIKKTGFASYFLIVADFVNEAKRRGILVGPGRGSAAGSIVSYLTNITNLDPLAYNLLFERFLNPERVSMPDIDLDFADDRRDEVIEYVRERYGRGFVAQIITFGTMAARAAVRDAGRALAYPYTFCDMIAKLIPPFTDFDQALAPGTELRAIYDGDPQAKRLIDTARKLEGVARHASTHAAGVVIGDAPLTEYVPLQYTTTGDAHETTVTQYAMGSVEALGLLKMDFLGLKNLTVIARALQAIEERHHLKIDLDRLPLNDETTYQLLQAGATTGVFQLESSGMKRYLRDLKPTEFEDIISMVALYRPGPMDSIPDFIAAKHGRKEISYLHPLLQPILEKTYGVIVTQDQVLQIAREFAGFT
ncbi:MAG: DNA polymerase III subunit alpha, partial [Patescibacteria group bacterium]